VALFNVTYAGTIVTMPVVQFERRNNWSLPVMGGRDEMILIFIEPPYDSCMALFDVIVIVLNAYIIIAIEGIAFCNSI
jgi:16S rRNA G966 N2-methylase RsmD